MTHDKLIEELQYLRAMVKTLKNVTLELEEKLTKLAEQLREEEHDHRRS
jgi:hypothetical protein